MSSGFDVGEGWGMGFTVGREFTAIDGTYMSGEYLHRLARWYCWDWV